MSNRKAELIKRRILLGQIMGTKNLLSGEDLTRLWMMTSEITDEINSYRYVCPQCGDLKASEVTHLFLTPPYNSVICNRCG